MSVEASYDDRELVALINELPTEKQSKAVRNALRNAMRRLGAPIRRRVIQEAEADGIKMNGPLKLKTNSVRVVVFKKTLGFKVTIVPKRKAEIMPILPWLATGTAERWQGFRSITRKKTGRVYNYGTRKKYTGRLSTHDFGERAYDGALGHTQYRLKEAIIEATKKQAAKHGAR